MFKTNKIHRIYLFRIMIKKTYSFKKINSITMNPSINHFLNHRLCISKDKLELLIIDQQH